MTRQILTACVAWALWAGHVSAEGLARHVIHDRGYGPLAIGRTVAEGAEALGVPLERAQPPHPYEEDCHYVFPNGKARGLGFMVEGGVLTRLDHWTVDGEEDWLHLETAAGLTIGSSEEQVRAVYGTRIREDEHPYAGNDGKMFYVSLEDGLLLVFEMSAQTIVVRPNGRDVDGYDFRVREIRVGYPRSASLTEGCS